MLCSLTKSNWLDRLRSNKCEPQNLNLDYYPELTQSESTHSQDEPISSILSHLFIMDHNTPKPKKLPRKQPNPKFHSTSSCEDNLTASNNNSDNNSNNLRENDEDDDEEEMKGYSRSEVAVIDTSCQVWRMDKLVYRKKSVWRVREKKGRGGELVGRKRKRNNPFHHNDDRKEEISPDSSGALSQVPKNRLKFFRSPRKLEKSGSSSVLIRAIPTAKKIVKTPPKNHLKDV